MKTCTAFRSKKYDPAQKVLLYIALIGTGVVVSIPLAWFYNKIQMGYGIEAAQVGLATGVVGTLIWTTYGIKIGYKVDRAIQGQQSIFSSPIERKWAMFLMRVWGYEMICKDEADGVGLDPAFGLEDLGLNYEEAMSLINQPRRRGRRPDFTLEQWLPITVKWETRDPIRDAFTLGELISEYLGTNSDGSPAMSEQSY